MKYAGKNKHLFNNRVKYSLICTFFMIFTVQIFSKPFDVIAAKSLQDFAQIVNSQTYENSIKPNQVKLFLKIMDEDNVDQKIVASLWLSLASDSISYKKLRIMSKNTTNDLLQGAALYSINVRNNRNKKSKIDNLLQNYSTSSNQYERFFIVNNITHKFKKQGVNHLLKYVKNEKSDLIKYQILFHLANENDSTVTKEILEHDWPTEVSLPENIATIFKTLNRENQIQEIEFKMFTKPLLDKIKQRSKKIK